MKNRIALFLICWPLLVIGQTGDPLKITYVGNMGVLLSSGDQQVLIDGLHHFYKQAYQNPPDYLVDRLISGEGLGTVDLVLNTHIHGDHFSAALITRYLIENPKGFFVGSTQAKDSVLMVDSLVINQVLAPQPEELQGVPVEAPGYTVTAYAITHSNPKKFRSIQNLGYLIEVNGKKILHIGDADINPRVFHGLNFAAMDIDIAILPEWFLYGNYGPQLVEKFIGAKTLVATHLSPGDPFGAAPKVKERFPQAILFTNVGQEFSF